jgi:ribosomal protein L24
MTRNDRMRQSASSEPRDGDWCIVTGGTHRGRSGTVKDVNTSKTGHVTITVVQEDGDRFKTLARNVNVESGKGGKATRAASAQPQNPVRRPTRRHTMSRASRRSPPSSALKVRGKIFAMPAEGTLVLKGAARIDGLVASKRGQRFDPAHGRVMKE